MSSSSFNEKSLLHIRLDGGCRRILAVFSPAINRQGVCAVSVFHQIKTVKLRLSAEMMDVR